MSGLQLDRQGDGIIVMSTIPTNRSDISAYKNKWIFTKAPFGLYHVESTRVCFYPIPSEQILARLKEIGIDAHFTSEAKEEAAIVNLAEKISLEQMRELRTLLEGCEGIRIRQLAKAKKAKRKELAKDGAILGLSAAGTSILYTPASDFGEKALLYLLDTNVSTAEAFGKVCGVLSAATTAIVCLKAFQQLLAPSEATKLRRALVALGGLSTSIPLMIDTFKVNKQRGREFILNLMTTLGPGIVMAALFAYSIDQLVTKIQKSQAADAVTGAAPVHAGYCSFYPLLAVAVLLGGTAGVGSYWETENILAEVSPILAALSAIPVICRSPLFINSMLAVFGKLNTGGFTVERSLGALLITAYSLFTVGGYSDIALNGMRESSSYTDHEAFRSIVFPIVLGTVVVAMIILNGDGILATWDRYRTMAKPKDDNSTVLTLTDPEFETKLTTRIKKSPPTASEAALLIVRGGVAWSPAPHPVSTASPTDPLLPHPDKLPRSYSLNTEPSASSASKRWCVIL